MKLQNKLLISSIILITLTILAVIAVNYFNASDSLDSNKSNTTGIDESEDYEWLQIMSFSLHNNDDIKHKVFVEIYDPDNNSIFRETYVLNSSEVIYQPNIERDVESGVLYTIELNVENYYQDRFNTTIQESEHAYIHITGDTEEPFKVRLAIS